jgi:hypothetical protein
VCATRGLTPDVNCPAVSTGLKQIVATLNVDGHASTLTFGNRSVSCPFLADIPIRRKKKGKINLQSFFLFNKIGHLENDNVHCTAVSTNTIDLKAILSIECLVECSKLTMRTSPVEGLPQSKQ